MDTKKTIKVKSNVRFIQFFADKNNDFEYLRCGGFLCTGRRYYYRLNNNQVTRWYEEARDCDGNRVLLPAKPLLDF